MKKIFICVFLILLFSTSICFSINYFTLIDPNYVKLSKSENIKGKIFIRNIKDSRYYQDIKEKNVEDFSFSGGLFAPFYSGVLPGYEINTITKNLIKNALNYSGYEVTDNQKESNQIIDVELIDFFSKWYFSGGHGIELKIKITSYTPKEITKLFEIELSTIYGFWITPDESKFGLKELLPSWNISLNKLMAYLTIFFNSDIFTKASRGEVNNEILSMDLTDKKLTSIESSVNIKLFFLNLSENKITNFDFNSNLNNISILDLRANKIYNMNNIKISNDIESLSLRNCNLTKIENLDNFKNLKLIDISYNDIGKIENLDNLINLKWLILNKCNKISKIENLDLLQNLILLDLGDCDGITKIENLDKLNNLLYFSMANSNGITKIEGLENLTKLKYLNISNTNIKKLENLDNLVNLESLDLSYLKIQKIENLNNLKKLNKLSIYNTTVKILENLEELDSLKELIIIKDFDVKYPKKITKTTYDFLKEKNVIIDGNMNIDDFVKKYSLKIE